MYPPRSPFHSTPCTNGNGGFCAPVFVSSMKPLTEVDIRLSVGTWRLEAMRPVACLPIISHSRLVSERHHTDDHSAESEMPCLWTRTVTACRVADRSLRRAQSKKDHIRRRLSRTGEM